MGNIAVKVSKAGERALRAQHPWVYASSITKLSKEGQPGDLCIIYGSKKNKVMAIGLYDPVSPIRIKVIYHEGPAQIDALFWEGKVRASYEIRSELIASDTNGYRLLHGENDGLPGIVADVYDSVCVVKVYSAVWLPYLNQIYDSIERVIAPAAIVQRSSRLLQQDDQLANGVCVRGRLTDPLVHFVEHGVKFSAHVINGHKTGYFLDHRANRHRVGQMSKGKTVLDIFSYAGGFSSHAAAGGATKVVSVDISRQALEIAKYNISLNDHQCTHETMAMDAFEAIDLLQSQRQKFDIVVVDPPSFAKRQEETELAIKQYKRLAKQASQLVQRHGTLLLASCSARVEARDFFEACEAGLSATGRQFQLDATHFHDVDHPIAFPQGSYLKTGYYTIY
jgi:23S rRNA (cytosine1962-C5)-methyltransferase